MNQTPLESPAIDAPVLHVETCQANESCSGHGQMESIRIVVCAYPYEVTSSKSFDRVQKPNAF